MKFAKILCIAALIAMSAAVANAGSIVNDPKLLVNVPPGGVGGVVPALKSFGKNADPMFTVELEYMGPTISQLIVDITPSTAF
jgi:hypothetical protein